MVCEGDWDLVAYYGGKQGKRREDKATMQKLLAQVLLFASGDRQKGVRRTSCGKRRVWEGVEEVLVLLVSCSAARLRWHPLSRPLLLPLSACWDGDGMLKGLRPKKRIFAQLLLKNLGSFSFRRQLFGDRWTPIRIRIMWSQWAEVGW